MGSGGPAEIGESAIFISYRRHATDHATHRLKDKLVATFGPRLVFLDVDNLIAGTNYRERSR